MLFCFVLPFQMSTGLGKVDVFVRNHGRSFAFLHLEAAPERSGRVATRLGLDRIVHIISKTRAGGRLVTASCGDAVNSLAILSDLLPNAGVVHDVVDFHDTKLRRLRNPARETSRPPHSRPFGWLWVDYRECTF